MRRWPLIAIAGLMAGCAGPAGREASVDQEVANPTLPTSSWVLGSPPRQTILVLETARTVEQRRIGVRFRKGYGAHDGMALIGHVGPIDLDMADVERPYVVTALDAKGRVVQTWNHDAEVPKRIATATPVSAVLFVRKDALDGGSIEDGSLARMMGVPR